MLLWNFWPVLPTASMTIWSQLFLGAFPAPGNVEWCQHSPRELGLSELGSDGRPGWCLWGCLDHSVHGRPSPADTAGCKKDRGCPVTCKGHGDCQGWLMIQKQDPRLREEAERAGQGLGA